MMHAGDLAEPFPIVALDTDAMEAARAMAAARLPGLIVCGDDLRPYMILPGSQVLRFLIPAYLQEDAALDERASDELCRSVPEPWPHSPDWTPTSSWRRWSGRRWPSSWPVHHGGRPGRGRRDRPHRAGRHRCGR